MSDERQVDLPENVHWISPEVRDGQQVRIGIPDDNTIKRFRVVYSESPRERYDTQLNDQAQRLLTEFGGITVVGQGGGAMLGVDYDEPEGADQEFVVEGTMMKVLEATIALQEMLDRVVGLDPMTDHS